MSAVWTPYARDQFLTAVLANDVFTPPASFYLALANSVLVTNATTDMIDEPDSANGYSRLAVPLGSAEWSGTGFGEFTNNNPTAASLTITADCGLIVAYALVDSDVGDGNVWVVGTPQTPFQLNPANSPFNADDLILGLYE